MNTFNEKEYIRNEYIKRGILDANGQKFKNIIDYNIYPDDGGYIPKCTICESVYKTYKNTTTENRKVESPHSNCGCLWWEYFKQKLMLERS